MAVGCHGTSWPVIWTEYERESCVGYLSSLRSCPLIVELEVEIQAQYRKTRKYLEEWKRLRSSGEVSS